MVTMERLLCIWIEDIYRRNSPCTLMAAQGKAVSLFEDLKKKEGSNAETETFTASRGWFERCRKRKKLCNARLVGESASVDSEAAAAYLASLKKIIDERGFGEINEEDAAELLESHDEELSNSDLLEIEPQLTEDQEAPEPRNPEQAKTLSTKDLYEAFRLLENAMAIFTEKDPQQERSAQVNRMITDAYICYREIYERKKRHAQ
ncbi:hypothetical protein M514_11023 [Trichuris suis]|uniref:HTH CENPB-type domain-containing protein n=1 Tax=Trichuris suis TaxID=68888 RepID=A0A085LSY4_9BILA|nr:hypothetical protein M513_11023 [Trichuris suis]KFD61449.1 hypothetical protein M514_11023 [Trichuris suis]